MALTYSLPGYVPICSTGISPLSTKSCNIYPLKILGIRSFEVGAGSRISEEWGEGDTMVRREIRL